MATKMRTQRVMSTDSPSTTAQSMQRLEKAAFDAIESLDNSKAQKFNPVKAAGGTSYNANAWDFVVADGGSYVYLPTPAPGICVAVVSADASTIRVVPTSGRVRATTSVSVTSQGQTTFISDGVNWW